MTVAYQSTGFLEGGRELLKLLQEIPTTADKDRTLIDAWAGSVGLTGWYSWNPYTVQ